MPLTVEVHAGPVPDLILLREEHHLVALRDTEQEPQHLIGTVSVGVRGYLVQQERAALARSDELLRQRHPQQEVHLLDRSM